MNNPFQPPEVSGSISIRRRFAPSLLLLAIGLAILSYLVTQIPGIDHWATYISMVLVSSYFITRYFVPFEITYILIYNILLMCIDLAFKLFYMLQFYAAYDMPFELPEYAWLYFIFPGIGLGLSFLMVVAVRFRRFVVADRTATKRFLSQTFNEMNVAAEDKEDVES